MNFDELIRKRCSTRKFQNKELAKDILEKILEAGNVAPTARNMQPQKIYVIQSEEGISKIDQVTRCRYGSPVGLLVCADKTACWQMNGYGSYEMDATIVATHMMLEATNLGVDSLWVRWFDADKTKEVFVLDENIEPICFLFLGYRTSDCPESPGHHKRKDLSQIVSYI